MIETIRIKGMKCFDDVTVEWHRLNILAGKNSAGKSSIIQSILAVVQSCGCEGNPFRGQYMNLGKVSDVINKNVLSDEIQICVNHTYSVIAKDDNDCRIEGTLDKDWLNVKYLSADRIGVKETYGQNLKEMDQIGTKCEYAYGYLARHERDKWDENDERLFDPTTKTTFGGQVDYWLDQILGYTVFAEEIPRTSLIRVSFRRKDITGDLSPINVGTGVSYIAEVIIAALSCEKGNVLIIENPEIHLHPSGQAEFIMFLAFLAQCGIQIIVETHSDHIYNGARKCVHEDIIDKEDVAIYFFDKKENGCSEPVRIELNDEGKVTNQREGLFDQIKKDLDVILGW